MQKPDENPETDGTRITRPPIYVLSCIKDLSSSNIKKYPLSDYSVQCHHGTIRNFVECNNNFYSNSFLIFFYCLAHLVSFLNQCWTGKNSHMIEDDCYRKQQLLHGVTSYFE